MHNSLNSFSHSGHGHSGVFGFGDFSFGLSLFKVVGTSDNVVEFADMSLVNGQPWCRRLSFFCVIQDKRNWWERLGHTRVIVLVQSLAADWMVNLQVPRTFMALPSAEMNSIMFVVSGKTFILFFLTNLASTQSILAPVSASDQSVNSSLLWSLFTFTLRFIIGVGYLSIFTFVISLKTPFLPLLGKYIMFAAFTLNCSFF